VEEVLSNSVEKRRKRRQNNQQATKLPPNLTGYENNTSLYIAAELNYKNIKKTPVYQFKVGNEKRYLGYTNYPLKAETEYKVHVRATTRSKVRLQ